MLRRLLPSLLLLLLWATPAHALTCALGSSTGTQCQVLLTTTGTFTLPTDWPTNNTAKVECVGSGGAGSLRNSSSVAGSSGGGGEYAAEPSLVASSNVSYTIGTAGGTANTTFPGDTVTVTAHFGATGTTTTGGAAGSGSTNTTHFSGGAGTHNATSVAPGGGGAGGPHGVGAASATTTGGTGDNATVTGGAAGATGNSGTQWSTVSAGTGSGGGGAATTGNGGAGGTRGGGGGAHGTATGGTAAAGTAGLCVVTYTPAGIQTDATGSEGFTASAGTSYDYTGLTISAGLTSGGLICMAVFDSNVSGVTMVWDNGGTNQSLVLEKDQMDLSSSHTQVWGLLAPTAGNKTLHVAWTTASFLGIACASVQNAGSFVNPAGAASSAGAGSLSFNVTSAVGDMVFGAWDNTVSGSISTTTGTNIFIDNTNIGGAGGAAESDPGASTVTVTATLTGTGIIGGAAVDVSVLPPVASGCYRSMMGAGC